MEVFARCSLVGSGFACSRGSNHARLRLTRAIDLDHRPFIDFHLCDTKTLLVMSSVQFTALIRLPFARGDFQDPPQVSFLLWL